MANTTVDGALAIHGMNPQYLIPTIIRERIRETQYWKEECFGLNEATFVDKAVNLNSVGGLYANQRPTEFLALTLKLLQLQPEDAIIMTFLENEDYKYLSALAAFYVRLTGSSVDVYKRLEPMLNDYRKLRFRGMGGYSLTTMDQFIDDLLRNEMVLDVTLPHLAKRITLEETDILDGPRISRLEDLVISSEDERDSIASRSSNGTNRHRHDSSRSSSRSRSRSRSVSQSKSRSKSQSQSNASSPSSKD